MAEHLNYDDTPTDFFVSFCRLPTLFCDMYVQEFDTKLLPRVDARKWGS
jgi:hypothetical protein